MGHHRAGLNLAMSIEMSRGVKHDHIGQINAMPPLSRELHPHSPSTALRYPTSA